MDAAPKVEQLARIIANAMGDNYSDAFKNKERWTAKRGMSGGRFREVNEPMQCDYLAAAQAAIAAMQADDNAERIKRERDQAVKALRFYARENSWKTCGMYMSGRPNPSSAEIDKGNKARQALASIEGGAV